MLVLPALRVYERKIHEFIGGPHTLLQLNGGVCELRLLRFDAFFTMGEKPVEPVLCPLGAMRLTPRGLYHWQLLSVHFCVAVWKSLFWLAAGMARDNGADERHRGRGREEKAYRDRGWPQFTPLVTKWSRPKGAAGL